MKRWAFLAVLILPGCGLLSGTQDLELSPEQEIFRAQGELNIFLEAAVSYSERPVCTPELLIGCADPDIKTRILGASERAVGAIERAKALGSLRDSAFEQARLELNRVLVEALR